MSLKSVKTTFSKNPSKSLDARQALLPMRFGSTLWRHIAAGSRKRVVVTSIN